MRKDLNKPDVHQVGGERGEGCGQVQQQGVEPIGGDEGVKRWPGEADGHMLPSGIEIAVR